MKISVSYFPTWSSELIKICKPVRSKGMYVLLLGKEIRLEIELGEEGKDRGGGLSCSVGEGRNGKSWQGKIHRLG